MFVLHHLEANLEVFWGRLVENHCSKRSDSNIHIMLFSWSAGMWWTNQMRSKVPSLCVGFKLFFIVTEIVLCNIPCVLFLYCSSSNVYTNIYIASLSSLKKRLQSWFNTWCRIPLQHIAKKGLFRVYLMIPKILSWHWLMMSHNIFFTCNLIWKGGWGTHRCALCT